MKSTYLIINTRSVFSFTHVFTSKSPQVNVLIVFMVLCFQHISSAQNSPEIFHQGRVLLSTEKIAGNFGELRENHLHSGIDYKTNETEGWPILAADFGYVSRVKISSTGYGKALYITHPGGIVTVYGHLRAFYPQLADSIEKLQRQKKQFEVEIFPDSSIFRVNAGQLIGFSGNTGSSQGPHLHFETRHEKTEKPVNPELYGYSYDDSIPPVVKSLVIYSPGPFIGLFGADRQIIEIDSSKKLKILKPIICPKQFFIGFEGYDLAGNEPNPLGVRAYSVIYNDSVIFHCRIDSFSFDETRFANAMIDYSTISTKNRQITLCYVQEGNKLPFYSTGNGLINLGKKKSGHVKLVVEDTQGNTTEIEFEVATTSKKQSMQTPISGTLVKYDNESGIPGDNFQLRIGSKSFYENVLLETKEEINADKGSKQPVIHISPELLPVHDPIELSLKIADSSDYQSSKLVIVTLDSTGAMSSIGGKIKDGWITARTRTLGRFTIIADTVPPDFMNPYFAEDVYSGNLKLVIPAKPDLTGISSYSCTIDNQWVCGEYNSAKSKIEIFFSKPPPLGTSLILGLEAIDGKGNKSSFTATVVYQNP